MIKVLFDTIKKHYSLFPNRVKKNFFLIQILVITTSLVDLFGFVVFVPVFTIIFDPEILRSSSALMSVNVFFGNLPDNLFQAYLLILSLMVFGLRSVFLVISYRFQQSFSFKMSKYIGLKTLKYKMNLDYINFQSQNQSELNRELTINVFQFSKFLITPVQLLLSEIIIILLIVTGIALYDIYSFFLVLICLVPTSLLFYRFVKKKIKNLAKSINVLEPLLYENCLRAVYGFVDINLRNKEFKLYKDYKQIMDKIIRLKIKSNVYNILPAKFFELITVFGVVLLFIYSNLIVNNPVFGIKILTIYIAASYKVLPSLSKIVPSLMLLEQYSYLFDVFKNPLHHQSDSNIKKNQFSSLGFETIELRNIGFSYDNHVTLKNINLKISKGETVGIIGDTGSGKTTLMNIISGLLIPNKGKLIADNIEINRQNIINWKLGVAYVPQQPYLESGTLIQNIAFLEDHPNEKKVMNAIKMASLSEFISNGKIKNIKIKELGKNLSVGQKQRIMIARALYNDCKLILFDESTSSLDNKTENDIVNTNFQLKKNKVTVIIVAHRLSTLVHADKIFKITNKTINKSYSYHEILKSNN